MPYRTPGREHTFGPSRYGSRSTEVGQPNEGFTEGDYIFKDGEWVKNFAESKKVRGFKKTED